MIRNKADLCQNYSQLYAKSFKEEDGENGLQSTHPAM